MAFYLEFLEKNLGLYILTDIINQQSKAKMRENLQQDLVRELFDYNPENGILINRVTRSHNAQAGQEAGCLTRTRYRSVRINGHHYRVHNIVWLWVTGHLPDYPQEEVDHWDNVKNNNEWKILY